MKDIRVYLDNSATTQPFESVVERMTTSLREEWINPSALYAPAVEVTRQLQEARGVIARALSVRPEDIYFHSGGTEGDNHAILGSMGNRFTGREIIVSTIEHAAVREACMQAQRQGALLRWVKPNKQGVIESEQVLEAVNDATALVSIMHCNNETGAINDINRIASEVKRKNAKCIFHSDGVQAFLKLPFQISSFIDVYTVSAHKIHGPRGIGVQFVRKDARIKPYLFGGGQERGMRSGTENTAGILGMAAAVEEIYPQMQEKLVVIRQIKADIITALAQEFPDIRINSPLGNAYLDNIISMSVPGLRGETILHALEAQGIIVGTGSACSSKKGSVSTVLTEMGLPKALAEGTLRVSIGYFNRPEDAGEFINGLRIALQQLSFVRRR